jgi:hypothetical protein
MSAFGRSTKFATGRFPTGRQSAMGRTATVTEYCSRLGATVAERPTPDLLSGCRERSFDSRYRDPKRTFKIVQHGLHLGR